MIATAANADIADILGSYVHCQNLPFVRATLKATTGPTANEKLLATNLGKRLLSSLCDGTFGNTCNPATTFHILTSIFCMRQLFGSAKNSREWPIGLA